MSALIGRSRAFRQVLEAIAVVAPVDSAVLLIGETGTGTGLIARAIQDANQRGVLSAVGYHQPPVYFLRSFRIADRRGAHVEPGGRLRLDVKSPKHIGQWVAYGNMHGRWLVPLLVRR
jgi:sigma-54 interacting transcriptional regulator